MTEEKAGAPPKEPRKVLVCSGCWSIDIQAPKSPMPRCNQCGKSVTLKMDPRDILKKHEEIRAR